MRSAATRRRAASSFGFGRGERAWLVGIGTVEGGEEVGPVEERGLLGRRPAALRGGLLLQGLLFALVLLLPPGLFRAEHLFPEVEELVASVWFLPPELLLALRLFLSPELLVAGGLVLPAGRLLPPSGLGSLEGRFGEGALLRFLLVLLAKDLHLGLQGLEGGPQLLLLLLAGLFGLLHAPSVLVLRHPAQLLGRLLLGFGALHHRGDAFLGLLALLDELGAKPGELGLRLLAQLALGPGPGLGLRREPLCLGLAAKELAGLLLRDGDGVLVGLCLVPCAGVGLGL